MSGVISRSLLRGALQAAVFSALAMLVMNEVPLVLDAGPGSVVGARSLKDTLGGTDRVELAISTATLNRVLDSDELTREQWVDVFTAPAFEAAEAAGDESLYPPEEWPLEGRFTAWSRPALALAATGGLRVYERVLESRVLGRLDPLTVEIPPVPAAALLAALAPLLAGLLMRPRHGLREGLLGGIAGAVITYGAAAVMAPRGVPRLTDAWREFGERLVAAGRAEPVEILTGDNVARLMLAAGVLVAVSVAVGLVRK